MSCFIVAAFVLPKMTNIVAPANEEKSESSELPHLSALSSAEQRRLEVIQGLESHRGQSTYREAEQEAARVLGLSVRTLKRLVRQYRDRGVAGLKRQVRSDEGELKTGEEWQAFILKTYRQGNRGMRQMSRAQVAKRVESRAVELGQKDYPSRRSVYRILAPVLKEQEQKSHRRPIGWPGEHLTLITREGIEIEIDYSNQVWQCDHTPADILVFDGPGGSLVRPTLTTVVDTHSRCIMGFHLGIERPSAAVTCLALRHAILPKSSPAEAELSHLWASYGVPRYLYTDAGTDFTSSHMDQVASYLGLVLCLRRRPAEGGIVERPFGTFNSEFFSTLPGYTTSEAKPHMNQIKADACLTLKQLESLLIRYIVDNYNQQPDARSQESRMARWQSGLMAQGPPPQERELDLLLRRQHRRRVYQGGYIRFANLLYRGEYLAGYAGEEVILRYDPRDITTVLVYRQQGASDVFLTRAHAQNLETERLSLPEAKAISRRLRQARSEITNQSVLAEIRDRLQFVDEVVSEPLPLTLLKKPSAIATDPDTDEAEPESSSSKPLPEIRVYDYEQLRQEHGI